MTRISIDVNSEWLEAARQVLGTSTKVATINEALRGYAVRQRAAEIVAAFDEVPMEFGGSAEGWRDGGGRDLSRLVEEARTGRVA